MQNTYKIARIVEEVFYGQWLLLDGRRVRSVSHCQGNIGIIVEGLKGARYNISHDREKGAFFVWSIGTKTEVKRRIQTLEKEGF